MRTEFSFLTGLANKDLRFKKFYPHFFYRKKPIPSLISLLKAENYHTICIHPHPAQFFQRDQFFKQLGFDEFIDIKAFSKNQKSGPYIADKAITEQIKQTLKKYHQQKIFIFAITMENHGPLHLEQVLDNENARYLTKEKQQEPLLNELMIYLRHLENADQMIQDLLDELTRKEALYCFYGDHLPNINAIFKHFNFKNNKTDYFVCLPKKGNLKKQIKVEQLAKLFFSGLDKK